MTGSTFVKIALGAAIFLGAWAHQCAKLEKFAPSLEDFSQTTELSGIYSYEWIGKNVLTRINGRLIYCSVDYGGGTGSCFVPMKHVPSNSHVTLDAAMIKTDSGTALYAEKIDVGGNVLWSKSPEESLKEWWFGSRLGVIDIPLIILALYLAVVAFIAKRS